MTATPAPELAPQLVGLLDRLAQTVVDGLGFGVAVVNLVRSDGSVHVVSVAGDEQAKSALIGTGGSAEIWNALLTGAESWGSLRFIDHRSDTVTTEVQSWVPDIEISLEEDAWHPEDVLLAPLVAEDGSLLGVMSVDLPANGRRPAPGICRALEAFAIAAAFAVEHTTLRERAEASESLYKELASHDQLTGVANRSALVQEIERAVHARRGDGDLLALVFVDLDGFKRVNDRHSHAAGDHVLQTVARRLRSQLRSRDHVARWGGDEFLVLLDHLPSEQVCLEIVQRLRAAVAEPIRYDEVDFVVTASVGVALLPREHGTDVDGLVRVDELVRRADAAMYEVKHTGRDAVAVHAS